MVHAACRGEHGGNDERAQFREALHGRSYIPVGTLTVVPGRSSGKSVILLTELYGCLHQCTLQASPSVKTAEIPPIEPFAARARTMLERARLVDVRAEKVLVLLDAD